MDMDKEIKNEFEKLARVVEVGFQKVEKRTDEKIDNLAVMVKKGFDGVDKRFDEVDKRFEKVEGGLDRVDVKLEHIDVRLSYIESNIEEIRRHFVYRDEFDDLSARVKYLETKLGIESGK